MRATFAAALKQPVVTNVLSFKEIANMKTSIKGFIARMLNSRETESVTNNRSLIRLSPRPYRVICATALAIASASAGATCVPNPTSYGLSQVPFTFTTIHQPGQTVRYTSYTTGYLNNHSPTNELETIPQWTGTNAQLYSDRKYPCTSKSCNAAALQPFDMNSADSLGVSVKDDDNVVLTLYSWGSGTQTFKGICDTTTNVLYGFGDDLMFAITFGTPTEDAPPK